MNIGLFEFFSSNDKLDPNEKLSKYFSVKDLTKTSTGINNLPDESYRDSLEKLARVLDTIYDKVGPIRVASAYRSEEVNDAVGGSPTSRHLHGDAADITPTNMGAEEYWANILKFDDLKNMFGHIAWKKHQGNLHVTLPFNSSKGWIQAVPQIADSYPGTGVLYMTASPYDTQLAFHKYFGDPAPTGSQPVVVAGAGGINLASAAMFLAGVTVLGMVIRRKRQGA